MLVWWLTGMTLIQIRLPPSFLVQALFKYRAVGRPHSRNIRHLLPSPLSTGVCVGLHLVCNQCLWINRVSTTKKGASYLCMQAPPITRHVYLIYESLHGIYMCLLLTRMALEKRPCPQASRWVEILLSLLASERIGLTLLIWSDLMWW